MKASPDGKHIALVNSNLDEAQLFDFDHSSGVVSNVITLNNNYSTFLVLFIMLSGHYSFIVYHKYNWLILCAIAVISVLARHYFNLRGRNIHRLYILIISILA